MIDSKANSPFLPLVSRPNPAITWLLRLVILPLLATIPILIYALPAIFVMESPYFFYSQVEELAFLIVAYSVLTGICWFVFQYFRKISSRAVVQIEVNETGVHYQHYRGGKSAVLYCDLTYSDIPYTKDVYSKTMHKGPSLLKAFWKNPDTGKIVERSISFDTDIVYGQYTVNSSDLIGHYIQGIRFFRPDLVVCESVYSNFFIHKDTHTFDKKDYIKTWTIVVVFVLIIVLLIHLYVAYRFGK